MRLFAGPFIGEFGWELFAWHAHLRFITEKRGYTEVTVASRPGHELLYEDFAKFVPFPVEAEDTCFFQAKGVTHPGWIFGEKRETDDYISGKERIIRYVPTDPSVPAQFKRQKFICFGNQDNSLRYDYLFHVRQKPGWSDRDWLTPLWGKLRDGLEGRIGCIGSQRAAGWVEGTDDLRGVPLKVLANVLRSSRMLIGPSSGPMHFAALCRCPTLVWTPEQNKRRLKKHWNPFDVPVRLIIGGWRPPVERVLAEINSMVSTLENALIFERHGFSSGLTSKPKRPLDDTLISIVKQKPPKRYLEIGTRRGGSLTAVLQHGLHPELLTICDPWGTAHGGPNTGGHDHIQRILETHDYQGEVIWLDGKSQDLIPTLFGKQTYDMILVDGDHRKESARVDLRNTWRLLEVGGLLIFDDTEQLVLGQLARSFRRHHNAEWVHHDRRKPGNVVLRKVSGNELVLAESDLVFKRHGFSSGLTNKPKRPLDDTLVSIVRQKPPKRYLEIGTRLGGSLTVVLKHASHPELLTLCDSWGKIHGGANKGNHQHIQELLDREDFRGEVIWLDGKSQSSIPSLFGKSTGIMENNKLGLTCGMCGRFWKRKGF